jgi:hypothetical protein
MAPNREIERLGQIVSDCVWETPLYPTLSKKGAEKEAAIGANMRLIGYALLDALQAVGAYVTPAKTAAVRKQAASGEWKVYLYDASYPDSYRWSVGARDHTQGVRMGHEWATGRWDGTNWARETPRLDDVGCDHG